MTAGLRQPHVATSPGRGPNRRSTSRFRPHDRARSVHSRCHGPSVTRLDDARSQRSLANPTRSTPTLATAPTSQIVTAHRPTTSSLATAATASDATAGPSTPASARATSTTGRIGRRWSAGAAPADTTPTASTQCLADADLVRRQTAPMSARSRIADTLMVNAASRLITLPPASRPSLLRTTRRRGSRPQIELHSVAPPLASDTIRAIRSSSGSVRCLASPPSNAATACSAEPSKNVSTRCRNADRRAARRGVTGRYTYRNPSSSWRTCPFCSRMRSCVRTVDELGSPGSSARTTLAVARPSRKRMSHDLSLATRQPAVPRCLPAHESSPLVPIALRPSASVMFIAYKPLN